MSVDLLGMKKRKDEGVKRRTQNTALLLQMLVTPSVHFSSLVSIYCFSFFKCGFNGSFQAQK